MPPAAPALGPLDGWIPGRRVWASVGRVSSPDVDNGVPYIEPPCWCSFRTFVGRSSPPVNHGGSCLGDRVRGVLHRGLQVLVDLRGPRPIAGPRLGEELLEITDAERLDLRAAVNRLPALGSDGSVEDAHGEAHGSVPLCQNMALSVNSPEAIEVQNPLQNPAQSSGKSKKKARLRGPLQKWSRGDSNPRAGRSECRLYACI